jgi:hypothetical protein
MNKMEIKQISVNDLIPYINNARNHSEKQISKIAASIKEFGFTNPILTDSKNGIIAGHGRLQAAQKLKLDTVPVIELSGLSDIQKKAYIIADNKLALNAGWDEELLKMEILNLKDLDFDIGLLGFDELELSDFKEDEEYLTDEDSVPETPEEPITKIGDIWVLDKHRLMCGDSTSIDAVEKLMDGKKADMVFTDPPYGISIVGGGSVPKFGKVGGGSVPKFGKVGCGGVVDAKVYSEIIGDDTIETARDYYNTCISAGLKNFIIWGGNYFTDFLKPSMCWIVWDKENSGNFADVELAWCSNNRAAKLYKWMWNGMSRKGDHKTEGSTRVHPTQKPVGLFVEIFKDFEFKSCYDGFCGSGSTLIACEKTNRINFSMELDPKYCDVIIKRWQDFTGKQAVLESTNETFATIKENGTRQAI